MTDLETLPALSSRRRIFLAATAMAALPLIPALAAAQVGQWEFYEPRPREFSRLRKVADKMAIEFAGQRIEYASWGRLSEAEQAIVRQAQMPPLPAQDEPPYPSAGLRPLIERLHRARGPVNAPLRLHLTINDIGTIEGLATDAPVPGPFLNELLQLLVSSGFKPAECDGKKCTGKLTLDIVYLGE
jgi:hypothetical protein